MMSVLQKEKKEVLGGKLAFELYDTYGFPLDLTELILKESNFTVDVSGFTAEMDAQNALAQAQQRLFDCDVG